MNTIFSILLKMSLQASVLIGLIMVVRIFMTKFSKVYLHLLWLLVLLRLLCPIFIESNFSLMPSFFVDTEHMKTDLNSQASLGSAKENLGSSIVVSSSNTTSTDGDLSKDSNVSQMNSILGILKAITLKNVLSAVWLIGIIIMSIVHIRQYALMKRKLVMATHIEKNIWACESVISPFVMGVLNPKIYLPYEIEALERSHIISHEMMHIRHFDPQVRVFSTIALCIHWWNPVVWLAIFSMNKDFEMYCDESVLKGANFDTKKAYSRTLLHFAMKQSGVLFTVSFGETNTEKRVKNIFNYHKPKLMISAILMAIVVGCAFFFLTVPKTKTLIIKDENVFVDLVLTYLEHEDKIGLASLVKYPIQVMVKGQKSIIYNSEEFVLAYGDIIQDDFKSAILSTDKAALFTNQYGIMLGNGEMWLDKFENLGYRIYAINNAVEASYYNEAPFKKSWEDQTLEGVMSSEEKEAWYARLQTDIPHVEESYEVCGLVYEDMDLNGTKDLMLLVKLYSGAITPESYPSTYLCTYMNDDSVHLESYDNLALGFTQVLFGDIDNDGYGEIVCSINTGGVGGAGSSQKLIYKYKHNALEKMAFPSDDSEIFSDGMDVGFNVQVLYGTKENEYKASCERLEATATIRAKNAVDEKGKRIVQHIKENEIAGGNCRGFTNFSIIKRDGRAYLMAREYLYGEGGINQGIGWAIFLMDWDENVNPSVIEFGVEKMSQ